MSSNPDHEKRYEAVDIERNAKSTYDTADTGAPRPDPRLDPNALRSQYDSVTQEEIDAVSPPHYEVVAREQGSYAQLRGNQQYDVGGGDAANLDL